jgi:hypothetical protein
MAAGFAQPGAGRPPTNLHRVIEELPEQITDAGVIPAQRLTIIDAIVDTMERMGFLHDAAARVGFDTVTVREWRRVGARANADVLAGKVKRSDLTAHQKRCAELATRLAEADAKARMGLLGTAQALAVGGIENTETVTKAVQVNEGEPRITEITTRTTRTLPHPGTVMWLLQHRWPNDFARNRLEVSGPEGGPVPVDITSARDRINTALTDLEQRQADTAHHAGTTPTPAGNGHTPTG